MGRVEKIEEEIRSLSAEERARLWRWLLEFDAEAWDREIEADAKSGRLDGLADEALRAHRSGESTPL